MMKLINFYVETLYAAAVGTVKFIFVAGVVFPCVFVLNFMFITAIGSVFVPFGTPWNVVLGVAGTPALFLTLYMVLSYPIGERVIRTLLNPAHGLNSEIVEQ